MGDGVTSLLASPIYYLGVRPQHRDIAITVLTWSDAGVLLTVTHHLGRRAASDQYRNTLLASHDSLSDSVDDGDRSIFFTLAHTLPSL